MQNIYPLKAKIRKRYFFILYNLLILIGFTLFSGCRPNISIEPNPTVKSCTEYETSLNKWSTLNATKFSGMAIGYNYSDCAISECSSGYRVDTESKSCSSIYKNCDEQDVQSNGWNTLNANSFSGQLINESVSDCRVTSCKPGYVLNTSQKSCEAIITSCTMANAQANGWDISNATSPSGNVIAGDTASCSIGSCDSYYSLNLATKKCDNVTRHVFLVIGQSNSQGQGNPINCGAGGSDEPNNRIVQWSRGLSANASVGCEYSPTVANEWITAREPLQHYSISHHNMGFALTFAKKYLETISATETVGLVLAAQGGTSFYANNWSAGGVNYLDAVDKVNRALATQNTVLKGILWHQGESDSNINHTMYMSNLRSLISRLRTDVPKFTTEVPFLAGELAPDYIADNSYASFINSQLEMLRQYEPMTFTVDNLNLTTTDRTHFNKASLYILGERYFNALNLVSPELYKPDITNISLINIQTYYITSPTSSVVGTLSTAGGTPPYTYTIQSQSGNFLGISGNNLVVQNTGAPAGLTNVEIRSTDYHGKVFSKNFSINVEINNLYSASVNGTGFINYNMSGTSFLDLNNDFTTSIYFKPTTASVNHALFSTRDTAQNNKGIVCAVKSNYHIEVALWDNSTTNSYRIIETYDSVTLNAWNHVVFKWNSAAKTGSIYLNGTLRSSLTGAPILSEGYNLNSTKNLYVGSHPDGATKARGKFSELSFWNVALSDAEVLELYTNKNPLTHSRSGNLAHYLTIGANTSSLLDQLTSVTGTATNVVIETDAP